MMADDSVELKVGKWVGLMADWLGRKWVGMKVGQKVGLWVVSMVDQ